MTNNQKYLSAEHELMSKCYPIRIKHYMELGEAVLQTRSPKVAFLPGRALMFIGIPLEDLLPIYEVIINHNSAGKTVTTGWSDGSANIFVELHDYPESNKSLSHLEDAYSKVFMERFNETGDCEQGANTKRLFQLGKQIAGKYPVGINMSFIVDNHESTALRIVIRSDGPPINEIRGFIYQEISDSIKINLKVTSRKVLTIEM